jgi:hypothetical protein
MTDLMGGDLVELITLAHLNCIDSRLSVEEELA